MRAWARRLRLHTIHVLRFIRHEIHIHIRFAHHALPSSSAAVADTAAAAAAAAAAAIAIARVPY